MNPEYKDRLMELIGCYNKTKAATIKAEIFDGYYKNSEDKIKSRYEKNAAFMRGYSYAFIEGLKPFEELENKLIYSDDSSAAYYENDSFKFLPFYPSSISYAPTEALLVANRLNVCALADYERQSRSHGVPNYEYINPFYLYFYPGNFDLFIQLDISELTSNPRVVYISGIDNFEYFFNERQVAFPTAAQGIEDGSAEAVALAKLRYEYQASVKSDKEELSIYYKENSKTVIERIKNKRPRILVEYNKSGYATRHRMTAIYDRLVQLGFESCLFTNNGSIYKKRFDVMRVVNEFRPDIIITADKLRFQPEWSGLPKEIVFVTAHFDPYPFYYYESTPSRLKERDFIATMYTDEKRLDALPYDKERILFNPLTIDENLYKRYDISTEEHKKYDTDIVLVSGGHSYEEFLDDYLTNNFQSNEEERGRAKELCLNYKDKIREKGCIYNPTEWELYVKEAIGQCGLDKAQETINFLTDEGHYTYIQARAYATVGLDVLIDKGYTNIKLWGSSFLEDEKYKPFAMGNAAYGEELAKALQCAKIQFGTNPAGAFINRTLETMISGCLYLANELPEDISQHMNIKKVIKEDDCYDSFNNWNDLADKIDYYLKHEDERKRIAEKGREYVLKNHTTTEYINKLLNYLRSHFEEKTRCC